jgi:uroporphyrinogen decarboxylase
MIEGQTRGDISRAKQMLRDEPQLVRALLKRIAHATTGYLAAQIEAGASVVQLFDTWASGLTPEEYAEFELPATQQVIESLGGALTDSGGEDEVAKILFAKGSAQHLENMAKSGADVLSVDWATDLGAARQTLGEDAALQGNVDPNVLLGDPAEISKAVHAAIEKTGGVGHILNLGHGILPNTPVENAKIFVESARRAAVTTPARI